MRNIICVLRHIGIRNAVARTNSASWDRRRTFAPEGGHVGGGGLCWKDKRALRRHWRGCWLMKKGRKVFVCCCSQAVQAVLLVELR